MPVHIAFTLHVERKIEDPGGEGCKIVFVNKAYGYGSKLKSCNQPRVLVFGSICLLVPFLVSNCLSHSLTSQHPCIWVNLEPLGHRMFQSLFPFTRVPFGVPIFDPQPICSTEDRLRQPRARGLPPMRRLLGKRGC